MKLAAHPHSPRTAPQSQDCHQVRVRHGCTAIFTPSALFPGVSRGCTGRFLRSARAQRQLSRRPFAVRCAILSRMPAVWHRAGCRPSPSGSPSRSLPHPAESTPLGLLSRFASLRYAIGRVSRFPVAAHSRLMAAPCAAWRNTCLSVTHCA